MSQRGILRLKLDFGSRSARSAFSRNRAPKNPVWYHNVVKNPRVELQDGTVTGDYDAREVSGDEKAVWWERAAEAFPPYAEYQKKTDRQIPVFVLTPVS